MNKLTFDLWRIVLEKTFLSLDVLIALIVPIAAALITILIFRKRPLKSTGAWHNVGRRYMLIGCIVFVLTLIVYGASIWYAYTHKSQENKTYTKSLSTGFRDYYSKKKNFTQRLIDFAERVEETKDIIDEMDNFATNLPREEREKFGRAWHASKHGGSIIVQGHAFDDIEGDLNWTDERLADWKRMHGENSNPSTLLLKYTPEQLEEFKKSNWPKLYPMLETEQWIYIKNQILDINRNDKENALAFLRDIADVCQDPEPTESLNDLYDRLAAKACPTEMQKVDLYLWDSPKLLAFYKFSLNHRWWFRTLAIIAIYCIAGIIIVLVGSGIAKNGKKRIFK